MRKAAGVGALGAEVPELKAPEIASVAPITIRIRTAAVMIGPHGRRDFWPGGAGIRASRSASVIGPVGSSFST
ncbi:MAG: hypothetical protein JSS68_02050 [Actinobacteria bacterium]|nr:hypothetical protein [Actinomycetota bacterium]